MDSITPPFSCIQVIFLSLGSLPRTNKLGVDKRTSVCSHAVNQQVACDNTITGTNEQSLRLCQYSWMNGHRRKSLTQLLPVLHIQQTEFAWHIFFRSSLYDAFSVTRLCSVDDRMTSEWWWWWLGEDKHPCLKRDSNKRSVSKRSRPTPQT
jgi:hypothetical protein